MKSVNSQPISLNQQIVLNLLRVKYRDQTERELIALQAQLIRSENEDK